MPLSLPPTICTELELEGPWLTIWLNQPENRHALTSEMGNELTQLFTAIASDHTIRGVTLRGRDGIFCAGADLKQLNATLNNKTADDDLLEIARAISITLETINKAPQVVISVVEGAAIGGGLGLACAGDILIAHRNAIFSVPGTKMGFIPAPVIPYIKQKLSNSNLRRLVTMSERKTSDTALTLGLADYVCGSDEELAKQERKLRQEILRCAPGAIADTKALLHQIASTKSQEAISISAAHFARRMRTDEAKAGATAFFERTEPPWAHLPGTDDA